MESLLEAELLKKSSSELEDTKRRVSKLITETLQAKELDLHKLTELRNQENIIRRIQARNNRLPCDDEFIGE